MAPRRRHSVGRRLHTVARQPRLSPGSPSPQGAPESILGCMELWVCHLGPRRVPRGGGAAGAPARAVIAGELPELMLLLEHPPVYTVGRRSDDGDLPFGEAFYRERGIDVVRTPRGGQLTYHGPGQLVGYPIMRVGERARSTSSRWSARSSPRSADAGVEAGTQARPQARRRVGRRAQDRVGRRAHLPRRLQPRLRGQRRQRPRPVHAGSWPAGCPRCR